MKKEFTLWLEQDLIDSPERYAEAVNKSVSQVVADYFATLEDKASLPPIARSLSGILKDGRMTEQDYYEYLEKKYL